MTNDIISRRAAIEAVSRGCQEFRGIFAECEKNLNELPPEQPKIGKWVEDVAYYDEDGCPCIITRCNQCGEPNPVSNFCPNCGAKMEETD